MKDLPCIGEKVYLKSLNDTMDVLEGHGDIWEIEDKYGYLIGQRLTVTDSNMCTFWDNWDNVEVRVPYVSFDETKGCRVSVADLSYELPFPNAAEYNNFLEGSMEARQEFFERQEAWANYPTHFILYRNSSLTDHDKEMSLSDKWHYLKGHLREGPQDEYCYDEANGIPIETNWLPFDCIDPEDEVVGLINSNQACIAQFGRLFTSIYNHYGVTADTILFKNPKPETKGEWEHVKYYLTKMKRGGVFPRSMVIDWADDKCEWYYTSFKLSRISHQKLFFYYCVQRTIHEFKAPGFFAVHFMKKGMHPLMAYVMGYVYNKGTREGHTTFSDLNDLRGSVHTVSETKRGSRLYKASYCYPNTEKVLEHVHVLKHFLTNKVNNWLSTVKDEITSVQFNHNIDLLQRSLMNDFSDATANDLLNFGKDN